MNKLDRLEARLDRLERHNRRLRAALVAAGGAVLAACTALTATPAPDSPAAVRTRLLQIVDADDRVVAELGVEGLQLRDDRGRVRASLHHNNDETGLYIRDEAGDARIGVVHFAHGGSGVALHGRGLRGAAVLYYKNNGSLSFYDTGGNVIDRVPQNPGQPANR